MRGRFKIRNHASRNQTLHQQILRATMGWVPAPLPTAWTLEADSLFKWQRQAIGTPIAQALLPVEVRDELARRAIQALGAQSGVSAARHEDLLEQSVRAVVLRLNPQSTTNDIDTAVAAVCDDGPAFPFC